MLNSKPKRKPKLGQSKLSLNLTTAAGTNMFMVLTAIFEYVERRHPL